MLVAVYLVVVSPSSPSPASVKPEGSRLTGFSSRPSSSSILQPGPAGALVDNLIRLLKTQEISRSSQYKLRRIYNSDLVILDDLMFMAMDRNEANLFFQFVNKLYRQRRSSFLE